MPKADVGLTTLRILGRQCVRRFPHIRCRRHRSPAHGVGIDHEEYPELVDSLGWDEFEIAEFEQTAIREEYQVLGSDKYVPPIIISNDEEEEQPVKKDTSVDLNTVSITKDRDGNQQINVRPGVDQNDAVIRGSTTVSPRSAPQAVVQYTIVFDDTQQQAEWYTFIKWLRSDAGLEGDTVAEKLISFISEHTP